MACIACVSDFDMQYTFSGYNANFTRSFVTGYQEIATFETCTEEILLVLGSVHCGRMQYSIGRNQ